VKKTVIVAMTFLILISNYVNATEGADALTTQANKPANYIPMRDFFKNPEKTDFQVSPKGTHISFLQPWNQRLNVFTQKLSKDRQPEGEVTQVTFVKDRDIADYSWKGEHTILYSRDFGGDENYHIFAVDLKTLKEKDLTPFEKVRAGIIDDLEQLSETDVLIQTNQRNPEVFDVYRLNTQTGSMKMVAENPGKTDSWLTDHEGKVRVASESDGLLTKIYTRATEAEPFKEIIEFDYKDDFSPLLFTPDNKQLYASSNLQRDKNAIVKIDPTTGKELEMVFEHPLVDVGYLGYSKKRKVITAASFVTWKREYKFFDKVAQARYDNIKKQVGIKEISINSHNDNEDLFTVMVSDDKTAARYYLYDNNSKKLTLLADSRPWLDPENLAGMQPIQYKSRDGLTINGYLTLPKGSTGLNLPVIINPHGGPWVRDQWGYDSEAQFLANRGFAVLQMNYRGSTGYGKEFFQKSFKQWGRAMQDDITDGVKWLIDEGIADPKRIGIYGGSYGGYATLAGITFTPDLYACAVDYVGVSNLFTFMNTIPPYWKPFLIKLQAMVGDPIKDKELLTASSPVFHVDRIKTPLFVAQGAKDPRVNVEESNQIVNSLRKRGVEVQYMVKAEEGHGFRNEENRFEFYEAMEKFLEQHLM
jgi:dipeptidyl aminopeptidase/acylaminoacyl peptidase